MLSLPSYRPQLRPADCNSGTVRRLLCRSPLWCVMMTHSRMGRNERCVCTSSAWPPGQHITEPLSLRALMNVFFVTCLGEHWPNEHGLYTVQKRDVVDWQWRQRYGAL